MLLYVMFVHKDILWVYEFKDEFNEITYVTYSMHTFLFQRDAFALKHNGIYDNEKDQEIYVDMVLPSLLILMALVFST